MNAAETHICVGPDAGQLFGFLCALGLMEAATRSLPEHSVGLGFGWHEVGFRPVLAVQPSLHRDELVKRVHGWIARRAESAEVTRLGDDLPCDPARFEAVGRDLLADADSATDLLAAFGVSRAGADKLDDTAFRTMNGAGHQHFLKFAREIAQATTLEQVDRCLFARWTYEDPKPALRFDPTDDRRYALRADDPAKSSRAPIRTVRAANALAFEGLALLPVIPTERGAVTTLVRRDQRSWIVRWPLWERPISRNAVASLLSHWPEQPGAGIVAIFQARRLTVGKFRAFTPAERVS